ncbi:MAG: ATP-dependent helicase [Candidatus Omnitrophica bacterium]|nr:ATP-dependent helicase [Candidatus Omnitrophota bacterium]MDD5027237.1 ATP-dependent helicase [Candidatus Omnitrophota bacterium]MDD5661558.1 ATP-dependent helicase [Candidatus Omnitrophota bacterium]
MNKKIDYKNELNPAQLEAVKSIDGAYLVIAGAGSGKTRVLVHRVAYLVEKGIKPDEILLLTFTRRAAEEMLHRASLLLDKRCSRVSGGTFHSFANATLRRYAKALHLANNFSILDESDAADTINLIRARLGFDKTDKRFPRKRAILEVISKSINKSQKLADVLYDEYPQFLEFGDEIKKIREEYRKYKAAKSLLDYDDLLVYLKELLVNHADARLALSRRYRYIMVDEYQDTNKLQAYIACLLASEHKNIMVVGDDAQSIYSFRGANFRNIMDFPRLFKNTRIITLEENYRSTQPILNLTNEVIRRAKEKFEKNLYTRKKGGSSPLFIDAEDENAQSRYIADKILGLREEGIELKDIAVLFRSGWHSNDLEIELASRNIPFVKYGGQKFVEAAHIKDVISYLRIVYNAADQVSWMRALLLIPGIGPKSAERIIDSLSFSKDRLDSINGIKKEEVRKLLDILKEIDSTSPVQAGRDPARVIAMFLEYYQPLLKHKYDDFHKRINDLDSLLRIASRYKSLEQFLTDMALEPPERSLAEAGLRDKDDSTLTLSTIHSAKGLEWHTVFLIYVAEGHLPSYLSLEDEEGLEEERRLFYVASTRAKENLFLLKPHIDRSPRSFMDGGGSVFTQTSRFLDEDGIMDKFVQVEDAGDEFAATGAEFKEDTGKRSASDKEFLKMMQEYFRGQEED